jgi:hypothetical protein
MSPENRTPEDAQPLARPVHDQQLAKPAGTEQEEARGEGEGEQLEEAPQPEAAEGEKGPVEKVLDKAQENGWVYESVARQARERGLVSKADEMITKIRNMLAGG